MARKAGRSGQSNPDEDMGESPGSRPEALQYRGCSFRYGIDRFQFNKPASWTDWLDFFKRYLVSAGLMAADDDFKINELILCMGPEANAILKRSTLSAADRSSFDAVVEMFQRHFLGTRNIVYELARLHGIVQRDGEPVDSFISAVFAQAENCELDDLKVSPKELLTQCQLIAGMANRELAAQLQTDPTLTLEQVVQRLRLDATVASQQRVIAETVGDKAGAPRAVQNGQVESVLRQKAPGTARRSRSKWRMNQPDGVCKKCGFPAHSKGQKCPAVGKLCNCCKRMGHFARMCRSKQQARSSAAAVQNQGEPERAYFLGALSHVDPYARRSQSTSPWRVELIVNGVATRFKIDTGADVTCIPEGRPGIPSGLLPARSLKLFGPSGGALRVIGFFRTTLKHGDCTRTEDCYVVRGLAEALLSRDASEQLRLVQRLNEVSGLDEPAMCGFSKLDGNKSTDRQTLDSICSKDAYFAEVRKEFPELFDGLGLLEGEYNIQLKADAKPHALTVPRRVPLHYRGMLRDQLNQMVSDGVIRPVTEPTDWCSGIVVVPKKDGASVRICVDLTELNKGVRRSLLTLPSVEEELALLSGAVVFSKLDANAGFWQVRLSKESSLLTTFITPFGRFCFNRLPFGISSAPEYFQSRMNDILAGLPGVLCHMDDILVFGSSRQEHDRRLRDVLERLRSKGLTLNAKCQFGRNSLTFLGHVISAKGVLPDPSKVEAIANMPPPVDVQGVRRFNGMINHVGRFIDKLADKMKPLRDLLKEGVDFVWGQPQQRAFEQLKNDLLQCTQLALFDPAGKTIVSADASQNGLGAVLLQETSEGKRRPVAFASRCLTDTEQRYAQIEKEAYAVTWACERFYMFLVGKKFHVETDHRPLVALFSAKCLDDLPPRIQRFRMRLMRFNFSISYVPGKQLITADALSRAPVSQPSEMDEDLASEISTYAACVVASGHATENRLKQVAAHQREDEICKQLIALCKSGWPASKGKVNADCQPFWRYRYHLSVLDDGLLLYDHRLVIPKGLRREMLERIHCGHQGFVRCKDRARASIWWPGISHEIEEMVENCVPCASLRQARHEPMLPTLLPAYPWQVVASDIFTFRSKDYLVVIDYYSRYIEFSLLPDKTAATVIELMKAIFSRHGIPEIVRCDNGPCFSAFEFSEFANAYQFQLVTSSPRYAQSNGEAERAVLTVKSMLEKSDDIHLALLAYRTTPMASGFSPAELLFGRNLRTNIPVLASSLLPRQVDHGVFRERDAIEKKRQCTAYDRRHGARMREPMKAGQEVLVKDRKQYGSIVGEHPLAPRSHEIMMDGGGTLRRTTFHLLPKPRRGSVGDQQETMAQSHQTSTGSERPVRKRVPPTKFRDYVP
uniref:RNA-directed DNA polymerase n=1 Tax=Trichuris muris TaxID=70415 RepID=A0A5S6QFE8_TRIMR